MSPNIGRSILSRKYPEFKKLTDFYDVIMVADTIPDALPFILMKESDLNRTQLVLHVTNRFNYAETDPEYYKVMQSTSNRSNIHWVINNPFEHVYMAHMNVIIKNVTLVRPFGVSRIPVRNITGTNITNRCGVYSTEQILSSMRRNRPSIELDNLPPSAYGGPKTLALYKCFVLIPYQVSIMKMSQNMAEGVVTLIPSPRFMKEIAANFHKNIPNVAITMWDAMIEAVKPYFPNYRWEDYIEFYHPRYKDFFYHFDSWEELDMMTRRPPEQMDPLNLRNKSIEFGVKDRQDQLDAMADFFRTRLSIPL